MSESGLLTSKLVGLFVFFFLRPPYLLPFPLFPVDFFKDVAVIWEVQQENPRNLQSQVIRNVFSYGVAAAVYSCDLKVPLDVGLFMIPKKTKSVFITGGSHCVPVFGFLQFKPHLSAIKLEIKLSYLSNKSLLNNLWRGHHVTDKRRVSGRSEQLPPTETSERCWWYSHNKRAQQQQWWWAVELEDGKEAQTDW